MSRPNRFLTNRPKLSPRKCATFTPSEINHLLESSVVFVRSHTLYAMALGAGLAATHLNTLDRSTSRPTEGT